MLKTVNGKVLEKTGNRKVSDEKPNVLEGSGEGRSFSLQAGARKR